MHCCGRVQERGGVREREGEIGREGGVERQKDGDGEIRRREGYSETWCELGCEGER